VNWNGAPEIADAIAAQSGLIADEVLAIEITRDESLDITDAEIGLALAPRKN
jgi:hypothetical protein